LFSFALGLGLITPLIPIIFVLNLVAEGMNTMLPALQGLVAIGSDLFTIGAGFAAMGAGLIPFALGLGLITPLIPIISLLNGLGSIGISTKSKESSKSTESASNKDITDRLDKLIEILMSGADINIDGRQIGKWLGKHHSSVNLIENR